MGLKNILKWVGFIVVAFLLIYFLETYGVIGVLIFILGIALYKMYLFRDALKMGIRNIEIAIFGRTLDKNQWDKGEMKNVKIKITCKKKPLKEIFPPGIIKGFVYGLLFLIFIIILIKLA